MAGTILVWIKCSYRRIQLRYQYCWQWKKTSLVPCHGIKHASISHILHVTVSRTGSNLVSALVHSTGSSLVSALGA